MGIQCSSVSTSKPIQENLCFKNFYKVLIVISLCTFISFFTLGLNKEEYSLFVSEDEFNFDAVDFSEYRSYV